MYNGGVSRVQMRVKLEKKPIMFTCWPPKHENKVFVVECRLGEVRVVASLLF